MGAGVVTMFKTSCNQSSGLQGRLSLCIWCMQGWSGSALEGLGWLPTLGNLACLAWLALALCVSWSAKGAPDEAIFLLAPSLLLLSRDPLLFPGLRPSRRYSPCSVAVSSYLCMSALGSVVQRFWLQPVALAAAHQQTWLRVVMDLASLAAAMPNHFGFAKVSCSERGCGRDFLDMGCSQHQPWHCLCVSALFYLPAVLPMLWLTSSAHHHLLADDHENHPNGRCSATAV